MEFIQGFITDYAGIIIMSILTAIAGAGVAVIKKIYEKKCNSEEAQKVVNTCVKAVEQIYKDLSGKKKFEKALENVKELLAAKGILISDVEIRLMIESAVSELEHTLNKEKNEDKKEELNSDKKEQK